MSLGTYYNSQMWWRASSEACYQSAKVDGDNVGGAIDDCKKRAIDELGVKEPTLVELHWAPEWVGTIWRIADSPSPPPI